MADRKSFLLRLSSDVHREVERLAAAELRSVNAQIEVLVREALRRRGLDVGGGGGTAPPPGGEDRGSGG